MTLTNHLQVGKAYCLWLDKLVEVPGPHIAKVCVNGCPYLAGSVQGEGIECLWDDGTDIPIYDEYLPDILAGIGHNLHIQAERGGKTLKGGAGSGNFAHSGRPGHRGGSGGSKGVIALDTIVGKYRTGKTSYELGAVRTSDLESLRATILESADKMEGLDALYIGYAEIAVNKELRERATGAPVQVKSPERMILDSPGVNPEVSAKSSEILNDYKNGTEGSLALNSRLRDGMESNKAKSIEAAVNATSLSEAITVYRGADSSTFGDSSLVGSTISDKAFVSTSLLEGVAAEFDSGVMMEIRLPKGAKALNMDRWQEGEGMGSTKEYELLLQRNSTFRVIGDSIVPDETRRMILELVP